MAIEVEGDEAQGVIFAIEVRESGGVDSDDCSTIVSIPVHSSWHVLT